MRENRQKWAKITARMEYSAGWRRSKYSEGYWQTAFDLLGNCFL